MEATKFSQSVRIAIAVLMRILNGEFFLSSHEWKKFDWFCKIQPGKIEKLKWETRTGVKMRKVLRKVNFYAYDDVLVATVYLTGWEYCNKKTFWQVEEVSYLNCGFDPNMKHSKTPILTRFRLSEEQSDMITT